MINYRKALSISIVLCLILASILPVFGVSNSKSDNNIQEKFENDLRAIYDNEEMKDEEKIQKIVENLFTLKIESYRNNIEYNLSIFFDNSNELSKNLKYFIDKAKLDIAIKEQAKIKILWDKYDIEFLDININKEQAEVKVYVAYEYQMEDCDDPSFVGTEYTVSLEKIKSKWIVININSNDAFDIAHLDYGINIEALLNSPSMDEVETIESIEAKKASVKKQVENAVLLGFIDTPYTRSSAVSYAKKYASYSTRNKNFWYYNATNETDCQNFASQCVWAGFGGVATDSTAINGKAFPMLDNGLSGSRSWYHTSSQYGTPTNWSWTSCNGFKNYLAAGGYAVGPYGYEYNGVAYSNLGDVIHVKWDTNGIRHAMVITGFKSGSTYGSRTRDQIYVSAHSSDHNNVLLTTIAGASGNTLYTEAIGGNLQ
ncbi:amidase domain-containing protein [Lutispora sp.]|uniref:amidase domain-containing protein n=1 Tax=Lutispora sp. TaxID=2828727 RepID=UPI003569FBA5